MGTAAYMSPEQTRGRSAGKQTDIWAFGCVLYECLTRRKAFQGETVSDLMASILKGEPDWKELPAFTPDNIRILLRRCLQKDKKRRLHDIADARLEIDETYSLQSEKDAAVRRFPLRWIAVIGAGLLTVGFLIRPLVWKTHKSAPATFPVASVIKLEPDHSLDGMRRAIEFNWPSRTAMTISQDGQFIVYSAVNDAEEDAKPHLFMRRIDELEASQIVGTYGGISPFLSPDDRWVGFWADGKLKKVSIEGGVAQDICEAIILVGASWGVDDRIIFSDHAKHLGLSVVASSGGTPEHLTSPDMAEEERFFGCRSHTEDRPLRRIALL